MKAYWKMVDQMLSDLNDMSCVETDLDLVRTYCCGQRGEEGQAAFLARPCSTDEVSDLVRICVRNNITLVPQSGRTGLVGASVPNTDGHQGILSLERLDRPCHIDPVNRTVTCSAGMRLSELNRQLESHGLYLPIDISADPCVGGMVATNTGGSRLLRYGDIRQHVLGLTIVLGNDEGQIVHLGGALRKNATGPDWKQLFIGTSAAFGIITECTLSLVRRPTQRAAALLSLEDESVLPDLLVRLETQFGSLLSALEFMSANAMNAAHAHVPTLKRPFGSDVPDMALLVELSCDWPASDADRSLNDVLVSGLLELWDANEVKLGNAIFGRAEEIWSIRHALSEGVRKRGRLYAFDLSFRRGDVLRFRSAMKERLASDYPDIEVCDFGHVGDGGLHFNLIDHLPADRWAPERERAIRDLVVHTTVETFEGSFSAEHGIGPANFRYFKSYAPPVSLQWSVALESVMSERRFGRVHFSGDSA
jgi:FAD/FMN-containing dehydrogenase